MGQQSRLLFSPIRAQVRSKMYFCLMLHRYLWGLRLLEGWWLSSLKEIRQFQLNNLRFSLPTLTINLEFWFRSSKEKEGLLKIVINWVNSIWMISPPPREVFLKLKSPSILMKMVLWISQLKTKRHSKIAKSRSPITREDFLNRKLKDLSRKLRQENRKTISWRKKSRVKIPMKVCYLISEIDWKSRKLKINYLKTMFKRLKTLLMNIYNGWRLIMRKILRLTKIKLRK